MTPAQSMATNAEERIAALAEAEVARALAGDRGAAERLEGLAGSTTSARVENARAAASDAAANQAKNDQRREQEGVDLTLKQTLNETKEDRKEGGDGRKITTPRLNDSYTGRVLGRHLRKYSGDPPKSNGQVAMRTAELMAKTAPAKVMDYAQGIGAQGAYEGAKSMIKDVGAGAVGMAALLCKPRNIGRALAATTYAVAVLAPGAGTLAAVGTRFALKGVRKGLIAVSKRLTTYGKKLEKKKFWGAKFLGNQMRKNAVGFQYAAKEFDRGFRDVDRMLTGGRVGGVEDAIIASAGKLITGKGLKATKQAAANAFGNEVKAAKKQKQSLIQWAKNRPGALVQGVKTAKAGVGSIAAAGGRRIVKTAQAAKAAPRTARRAIQRTPATLEKSKSRLAARARLAKIRAEKAAIKEMMEGKKALDKGVGAGLGHVVKRTATGLKNITKPLAIRTARWGLRAWDAVARPALTVAAVAGSIAGNALTSGLTAVDATPASAATIGQATSGMRRDSVKLSKTLGSTVMSRGKENLKTQTRQAEATRETKMTAIGGKKQRRKSSNDRGR